jgi:hypothetical protein
MIMAAGISHTLRLCRRRQKGNHAAVANRCRFAVERLLDIKAWQRGLRSRPAKRRRPAIGAHGSPLQAERSKHGVIKAFRPLEITRSDGYMAEHLIL